jgi:GNAT superfamily N-acetyltransferase
MPAGYAITLATAAHVAAIPDIESRAAARFAEWHVPHTVLAQTTPLETLAAAQTDGRLWVALSRAGEPVGFGLVEFLDTRLHLEELDVLPKHGGLGVGTALVVAVELWARANRFREIVLTTFRDVPWNAPFYLKLGYEIVDEADLDAVLLTWLQDEGARGLDPARRVAMRKRLGSAIR